MNISIVGLGKLGAPLAAVFASKGHTVAGIDCNSHIVHLINEGKAPIFEPGLGELIQKFRARLQASTEYESALSDTTVTFIVVPTPSHEEGRFSLEYVLAVAESIGKGLRYKDEFHLIVLTSTVMPGETENRVLPILEKYSGKQCGKDFGLCYNPEFVALGSVIHDLLNPDFILIGESDPRSGEILSSVYKTVCSNSPPIVRMNFVNSELTKLAVNTFVTTKISYANMLAQVCEQFPGANVDIVTRALGLDSRIGAKYLKGAIGYGGPCFPRDNIAFTHLARELGIEALLAEATDSLNRLQVPRLEEIILRHLPPNGKVGILGLAYKPNTDVVEESQGLLLTQTLMNRGIPTAVYDPMGMGNARRFLRGPTQFAESVEECIQESDVIVITTPWEEFSRISREILKREDSPRVLVDCWRLLDAPEYHEITNYIAIGIGQDNIPSKASAEQEGK